MILDRDCSFLPLLPFWKRKPEEAEWQRLWELQKIDDEVTDEKYRGISGNGLDWAVLGESIREISTESNESVTD